MIEDRPALKNLFAEAKIDNSPLWNAKVSEVFTSDSALHVKLLVDGLEDVSTLDPVKQIIVDTYGLTDLIIETVNTETIPEKIRKTIAYKYPSLSYGCENADIKIDGNNVSIILSNFEVKNRFDDLVNEIRVLINDIIGKQCKLSLVFNGDETIGEDIIKKREEEYAKLLKEMAQQEAAAKASYKAKASPKQAVVTEFKKKIDGKKVNKDGSDGVLIYGKPSYGVIIPIEDILADSGRVNFEGVVFFTSDRQINGKDKTSVTIDISDATGAVRVSKLFDTEVAKKLLKAIKPGMQVIVQGTASYNKYEGDVTVSPTAIIETKKQSRQDNAEHKRVELHLHTNMSTMDALCDPGEVIKLAASMGHPAIAITDHGVVQAYPEAASAAKKNNIKVIYGVEAYFMDDLVESVDGNKSTSLDDTFICFDIETTGLSPKTEKITEIGAVKITNGQVVDRFSTFVNPEMPIPAKIVELTGITDAMVKDAPSQSEAVRAFLDFCGDNILVAHNAPFDTSFIRVAWENMGVE